MTDSGRWDTLLDISWQKKRILLFLTVSHIKSIGIHCLLCFLAMDLEGEVKIKPNIKPQLPTQDRMFCYIKSKVYSSASKPRLPNCYTTTEHTTLYCQSTIVISFPFSPHFLSVSKKYHCQCLLNKIPISFLPSFQTTLQKGKCRLCAICACMVKQHLEKWKFSAAVMCSSKAVNLLLLI